MNIIYTGAFRFPNGDAAAPRVLNNAKILRELGFNVFFVSFGGKPRSEDKNIDGNYYYQGFRYINTEDIDVKQTNPLKRIYRFIFSGKKAIKIINSIISDTDFVIGYQPSSYFTQKMMKICNKKNKQFISDLTEWYDPNEFPGGIFAPPSWLNEWNMRFTQRKVKNKIVISSFLDKYYPKSNNIIIPPLVDQDESKWLMADPALQPFTGIRLIYAGNPAKKDLLATMLDAVVSCVKKGQSLQFIIVGVKMEQILHYPIYNEVKSYPNNFIFCGKIPQEQVPSYYFTANFSIIIRENTKKSTAGFPTKLAESLMSGCPVLLNYTSDIADYVQDGYNGFISPDSTSLEFQKILSKLSFLTQSDLKKMKENALQSALNKFDYSCYVNNMSEFIKRIN